MGVCDGCGSLGEKLLWAREGCLDVCKFEDFRKVP